MQQALSGAVIEVQHCKIVNWMFGVCKVVIGTEGGYVLLRMSASALRHDACWVFTAPVKRNKAMLLCAALNAVHVVTYLSWGELYQAVCYASHSQCVCRAGSRAFEVIKCGSTSPLAWYVSSGSGLSGLRSNAAQQLS
jgi:hypothetical protein